MEFSVSKCSVTHLQGFGRILTVGDAFSQIPELWPQHQTSCNDGCSLEPTNPFFPGPLLIACSLLAVVTPSYIVRIRTLRQEWYLVNEAL